MADYIDRDAFIMHLADIQLTIAPYTVDCEDAEQRRIAYQTLNDAVDECANFPAADVKPVVFCRDCKSCNTDIAVGGWYGTCAYWNGHSVMADDYCSRFRNKDSEDTRDAEPQKCDTCSHGAHFDGVVICDRDAQRHERTDGCERGERKRED